MTNIYHMLIISRAFWYDTNSFKELFMSDFINFIKKMSHQNEYFGFINC